MQDNLEPGYVSTIAKSLKRCAQKGAVTLGIMAALSCVHSQEIIDPRDGKALATSTNIMGNSGARQRVVIPTPDGPIVIENDAKQEYVWGYPGYPYGYNPYLYNRYPPGAFMTPWYNSSDVGTATGPLSRSTYKR